LQVNARGELTAVETESRVKNAIRHRT